MIYKRLSFFWMIIFGCFSISCLQNAQVDPFANMSDEEFAQMLNFIDTMSKQFEEAYKELTPEQQAQVDRELREELIRNNIDPDTLQPLSQPPPESPMPPAAPQLPATPPQPVNPPVCPSTTKYTQQQVSCLVQRLITLIESCRHKISLLAFDAAPLRHWLAMLTFYLKTINTADHLQRLTQTTYDRLFQLLTKLDASLSTYEPRIIIPKPDFEDDHDASLDPYRILGISPRATAEDITKSYEALCAAYDLKKIEQNLIAEKTSPQRIQRQLDVIKLQLRNIEDAYEQLRDPKLRSQIDRNALLSYQQKHALEAEAQRVVYEFQNNVHQIVLNGLFETFDQFFAQFEPFAVARRKEMEAAEQQRKTEQEARHRLVATPSAGAQGAYGEYPDWFRTPETPSYAPPSAPSSYGGAIPGGSSERPSAGNIGSKELKGGEEQKPGKAPSGTGSDAKPSKIPEQTKKDSEKDKDKNKDKGDKKPNFEKLVGELNKEIQELDSLIQQGKAIFIEEKNNKTLTNAIQNGFGKPEQEDTRQLAQILNKAFGKNIKLVTTINKVNTIAKDLAKHQQTQNIIISVWSSHKNRHEAFYRQLASLAKMLDKFADEHPETGLAPIFETVRTCVKDIKNLDKLAQIKEAPEEKISAAQQASARKVRRSKDAENKKRSAQATRREPTSDSPISSSIEQSNISENNDA